MCRTLFEKGSGFNVQGSRFGASTPQEGFKKITWRKAQGAWRKANEGHFPL